VSKILKLKKWLTLKDAAKQLTISTGEEITDIDILKFGAEGQLRLSLFLGASIPVIVGTLATANETHAVSHMPLTDDGRLPEFPRPAIKIGYSPEVVDLFQNVSTLSEVKALYRQHRYR